MKILFVAPPWRIPNQGTLAIATLAPMLRALGHEVDELYGSPLFPADNSDIHQLFQGHSRYAFGRALTGATVEDYIDRVIYVMKREMNNHKVISDSDDDVLDIVGATTDYLRVAFRDTLRKVDICLDRIVERAVATGPYDAICFSTTFDDQVPSSVVIARRLKALWPGVVSVFGGPACFEEQGDGLLATFPEIDVACHTEGEQVIEPLFAALAAKASLADVPGIVWRDGAELRHNPSPPLLRDMDRLPMPDYERFIGQLVASEWAEGGAQLFFETSRGCWWGEKSLCSFCGLNAEGLPFRSKSPERALDEIKAMYRRYPMMNSLLATDNIFDMRYFKALLPQLAEFQQELGQPLRIFYEVKSNMRLEQVEALAEGGVVGVQPGIESFSDGVLKLMRKGCTSLGQVQFIKWSHQCNVEAFYNVLVLNPGEKTEWYADMIDMLPFLTHLPAPQAVVTMNLERFSPYHSQPDAFGVENIRPKLFYREVFGPNTDPRVAYQFDYDHVMFDDKEHLDTVRRLVKSLRNWQTSWKKDTLYFVEDHHRVVVVDSRDGVEQRTELRGPQARIFTYLDTHRAYDGMRRDFAELAPEMLDALLLSWIHRRWLLKVDDRYLIVVPRKGPRRAGQPMLPVPSERKREPRVHLHLVQGHS
ncbi:MAG: RiPP maturation radical SAM C-methyltransferase [Deltaproteobacteria bacterium]|nr:RiPP maturation radical SAM C-methyltransferase [Deltaproteobacteria bacterium]MCW5805386.1 RiPP maturation radical SAM C-methyltransferase [Deltaproteobacteria bacterium]